MKKVLFGNRVIAMLLCLIMLSGVILTSCNKGSDTPAETSGKATVTDAAFKPEETRTPEIAAETVSFDQTAVTMTVGDTVALVATVAGLFRLRSFVYPSTNSFSLHKFYTPFTVLARLPILIVLYGGGIPLATGIICP